MTSCVEEKRTQPLPDRISQVKECLEVFDTQNTKQEYFTPTISLRLPHLRLLVPCGYWTSTLLGALSTVSA